MGQRRLNRGLTATPSHSQLQAIGREQGDRSPHPILDLAGRRNDGVQPRQLGITIRPRDGVLQAMNDAVEPKVTQVGDLHRCSFDSVKLAKCSPVMARL